MDIKVVSIVAEPVASMYRKICAVLENAFGMALATQDYGGAVREFIVTIVAVDDDADANNRFCVPNNKVGRYKDWRTHEAVKFISIALPFNPAKIEKMSKVEVLDDFCNTLIFQLKNSPVKVPLGFDYLGFSTHFIELLEIFRRSIFNGRDTHAIE